MWQNFYDWHDPVIFSIGVFSLRWYGVMYVTALLVGYFWGAKMVTRGDWKPVDTRRFEALFFYFVIGAVLGARLGYALVYDPDRLYLISHPWQIFNPFSHSSFGISGLSYHGAIAGAVISLFIFSKIHKISAFFLLDLAAVSGSAGYVFGRIGNFLNAELIGRETDAAWGVLYNGVLRHPSAVYEAFLEGICVFLIMFFLYKKRSFNGQMAVVYAFCYTIARFIAEFFRQPDAQLGFFGFLTMGQILSVLMLVLCAILYLILWRKNWRENRRKNAVCKNR